MCIHCDIQEGKPIDQSTGVTRRLREECAKRGITLADRSELANEILSFVQDGMLQVIPEILKDDPSQLPYLSAAPGGCAAEIDATSAELSQAEDN
jgi:hypothetical protein